MDDRIEQATAAPGEKRDTEIPHEKRCHALIEAYLPPLRCEKKIGHAGPHGVTLKIVGSDGE